ncbi:hypothetical protein CTAYLR_010044 [Chrysophaeum taylorii]|uniref:Cyclic nucleotide-binding domain-containing protein n=1 Tax=Chrysophaeum taylorii TaxID=2483200 RepID=A0AAD7U964_9STRA|nr:hypothetical protein CTAYLR_010044 [Chrysophaeum taylorii]
MKGVLAALRGAQATVNLVLDDREICEGPARQDVLKILEDIRTLCERELAGESKNEVLRSAMSEQQRIALFETTRAPRRSLRAAADVVQIARSKTGKYAARSGRLRASASAVAFVGRCHHQPAAVAPATTTTTTTTMGSSSLSSSSTFVASAVRFRQRTRQREDSKRRRRMTVIEDVAGDVVAAPRSSAAAAWTRKVPKVGGSPSRVLADVYVIVAAPLFASFECRGQYRFPLIALNLCVEAIGVGGWACGDHQRRRRRKAHEVFCFWTVGLVASFFLPFSREIANAAKVAQSAALLKSYADSRDDEMEDSDVDPIVFRIGKLALCFLVVIHYVSCAYHFVGREFSSEDDRTLGKFGFYAARGNALATRWSHAYYWAVSVILGNNLAPVTSLQAAFHVVVFLLGLTMTSTITGSIASLLANADVIATQRRMKMVQIRRYLKVYKVPDDLATTIRRYYSYCWTAHYNDDSVFDDLTDSLKLRLTIATRRRFIANCALFKDLDQVVVVHLVTCLKQKICVPMEIVTAEGEFGETMYFVSKGTLSVFVGDREVGKLDEGDHFGETALLTSVGRRNATILADRFVELLSLARDVLLAANAENITLRHVILTTVTRRQLATRVRQALARAKLRLWCYFQFVKILTRLRDAPPPEDQHYVKPPPPSSSSSYSYSYSYSSSSNAAKPPYLNHIVRAVKRKTTTTTTSAGMINHRPTSRRFATLARRVATSIKDDDED